LWFFSQNIVDCYSVFPHVFFYEFFQNFICRFYFFNIELVENLVLLFFCFKHYGLLRCVVTCFFSFFFVFSFLYDFFQNYFCRFYFFNIELIKNLALLFFFFKTFWIATVFPHMFFFSFFLCFLFCMIFSKFIFVDFIFLILSLLKIYLYNFFFKTLWIFTVFPHNIFFILIFFKISSWFYFFNIKLVENYNYDFSHKTLNIPKTCGEIIVAFLTCYYGLL